MDLTVLFRLVLYSVGLYFIFFETGPVTTLFFALIAVNLEVKQLYIEKTIEDIGTVAEGVMKLIRKQVGGSE